MSDPTLPFPKHEYPTVRRFDGQVVIALSDTDPGDMGEPREFDADGVTYLTFPSFALWRAAAALEDIADNSDDPASRNIARAALAAPLEVTPHEETQFRIDHPRGAKCSQCGQSLTSEAARRDHWAEQHG